MDGDSSLTPRRTVAIDLDGVLAQAGKWQGVTHIGAPFPGAVQFVSAIYCYARVIIHSARCAEGPGPGGECVPLDERRRLIAEWLDRHGFSYDEIWTAGGKPWADAYVDDKAIVCDPTCEGFGFAESTAALRRFLKLRG